MSWCPDRAFAGANKAEIDQNALPQIVAMARECGDARSIVTAYAARVMVIATDARCLAAAPRIW